MADNRESTGRHLRRLYRNSGETEPTKQLTENVEEVIIETINGGHRVAANMRKLFPDGAFPAPCMGRSAAAFGLNTVLGNAVAGKEKDDPTAVIELIQRRWDSILEGEWSEGRQGPTLNAVLDAWEEDCRNRGRTVNEQARSIMRSKILSGTTSTKALLENPNINVCYQQALIRKQQQKLAEAQAKAQGLPETSSEFDPD